MTISIHTNEAVIPPQILQMKDGGEVSLDWLDNPEADPNEKKEDYQGPIVLFLPGLTGSSQSEYIKSFINVANRVRTVIIIDINQQVMKVRRSLFQELKARTVVFNFRGRGGHALTTPRTYCASNGDDIGEVIDYIKGLHPKAPLMAVGVSLGGIILGNYLSQQGEAARTKLEAAMLVSVCFDTFKGTESLEKMGLNRMLNWHLANCLVSSIKEVGLNFVLKTFQVLNLFSQVRHHFEQSSLWDLDQVFSSRTIREFDSRFTSPLFGYNDVREYYTDAKLAGKLNSIKVPLLGLNAKDDPFQVLTRLWFCVFHLKIRILSTNSPETVSHTKR